jgi:ABC-2 type transport system ATP-binding protein
MSSSIAPTQPLLQARNLHKAYGAKSALKDVDVTLGAGEMVALLGPNGAGKSTLLQLLTGLFTPDQGSIEVLGHDMRQHPSRALAGLGVVFQQSALDMDLSVVSNLHFHTDLHGMSRKLANARIADLLQTTGLTNLAKSVVRSLSGGTRRKVELIRALLHEPRVLLMDEATTGLDPASRQQLLHTVHALCKNDGMGVLWATHLIEETHQADRLMLLHQGELRFEGSIAAFMEQSESADFQAEVLKQLGRGSV